jgi:hyperosmotically inducible protein
MKKFFAMATALALSAVLAACSGTGTQKTAGETIDDATLTAKVKAALIDNESTKARSINVETYRGTVQLGGFVESEQEKQAAGQVAQGVAGVQEVRNDLEVRPQVASRSAGEVVDDGVVTARVKAALTADPTTKARQINVETRAGIVQLSGFVDNSQEKERAAQIARETSGVQSVRNDLEVKQPGQQ